MAFRGPMSVSAVTHALQVALPITVGVCLIALAAFVAYVAHDRVHNIVFAALFTLSGFKSISEGVIPVAGQISMQAEMFPDAAVWGQIGAFCAFFMLPLIVLFVLLFPRPHALLEKHPSVGALLFVPSLAYSFFWFVSPLGLSLLMLAHVFNALAVAVTVFAAYTLWRTRRDTPNRIERTRARYLLIGFLPAFAATWVISGVMFVEGFTALRTGLDLFVIHYLSPVFEIIAAGVVGYAIVKYQLLGIELKVKIGTKYALTACIFFFSIFTISSFAQEFILQELFVFTEYYWLLGSALSVLLFKPLFGIATWATNRLFPDTMQSKSSYVDKRASDIYHAQVAYVLRDAKITQRERNFLDNLREQLGLSRDAANHIETEVEKLTRTQAAGDA